MTTYLWSVDQRLGTEWGQWLSTYHANERSRIGSPEPTAWELPTSQPGEAETGITGPGWFPRLTGIHELQIHQETLPQWTKWRAIEEGTDITSWPMHAHLLWWSEWECPPPPHPRSYICKLGPLLMYSLEGIRRCDLVGGRVLLGVNIEDTKAHNQAQRLCLCLLPMDQNLKLSAIAPAPYLSAFCHDENGPTLWNCKQAPN